MGTLAATVAATSTKSSSSSFTFILLIALVFIGFYFLMIRPQRRRQQQVAQQQKTVSPGARDRTTAGMYATVIATDADDVILEVAPGVDVRYQTSAIMDVIDHGDEKEVAEDDTSYDEDQTEEVEAQED